TLQKAQAVPHAVRCRRLCGAGCRRNAGGNIAQSKAVARKCAVSERGARDRSHGSWNLAPLGLFGIDDLLTQGDQFSSNRCPALGCRILPRWGCSRSKTHSPEDDFGFVFIFIVLAVSVGLGGGSGEFAGR